MCNHDQSLWCGLPYNRDGGAKDAAYLHYMLEGLRFAPQHAALQLTHDELKQKVG